MLRCPRCGKEFEDEPDDELETCDACGAELVTEGGTAVAGVEYTELVKVYDEQEVHELAWIGELNWVRQLLEAADIPVYRSRSFVGPPSLHVPAAFADRARRVIREVLRTPDVDTADLARLWSTEVVPVIAGGPARSLASALALSPEPFRREVLMAIGATGRRGIEVVESIGLAFAVQGPTEPGADAATYLAWFDSLRDRWPRFISALAALVVRGADRELALRVIAQVERFRGSSDAERALVPLLEHADAEVRDGAIEALFSISGGETLGFEPDAPEDARKAAARKWRDRVGRWPR